MNYQQCKEEALKLVEQLFGDTDADESDQIEALDEIKNLCEENIEVLKEQIRSNEREEG